MGKPRILYVDDQPMWRSVLADVLGVRGYEVECYDSLTGAQAAAEQKDFVLYICDGTVHQKYDGMAWALELHRSGKRVLLHSGDEPPKDLVGPRFLAKGCRGSELVATIEDLIK